MIIDVVFTFVRAVSIDLVIRTHAHVITQHPQRIRTPITTIATKPERISLFLCRVDKMKFLLLFSMMGTASASLFPRKQSHKQFITEELLQFNRKGITVRTGFPIEHA